jgi:hypothetical protein
MPRLAFSLRDVFWLMLVVATKQRSRSAATPDNAMR